MRNAIRTLHLSIALVAAIFVVILGVTGSIMAFEPELDHALHRNLWHVDPQGRPLSLDELATRVAAAYPGQRVTAISVSEAPDLAARVSMPGRNLFVNPYTGSVIGPGPAAPDLLARIHQLHLRLLWMSHPDAGKKIVGAMDIAMIFLVLSGFYLWWPLKRVTITWNASRRRRWLDVHAVTGIGVFVFLLLLGITGAAIAFDGAEDLMYRVTGSQPAARPAHVVTPIPAGRISIDRAMAIAAAAIPGTTPFQISIPRPDGTFGIRSRFPEDLTPGGRSRVEVDQYTGEVVFAEGSRTAPAGTRAVILNRAIHTGDVFGMPSRILMSLASVLTVVMATSGLLTWWNRRRTGR
ncbi:MAG: PepSY domain-containing protein [Vicinamibacterales bacterium]